MNVLDLATGSRCFKRFHPTPDHRAHLVCFPHAGGSATTYFPSHGNSRVWTHH